jgi:RNA polymerase sigma factor (sigma-70 family)
VAIGKDGAVVRQLRTLFQVGTTRELTDGQLLERFATERGETAELAFGALVERHGPMVLRVCRSVLNNSQDSLDAFQATFLVLVKKARGLWVRDSLGPWLHQVALRTALCARSRAARRSRHERQAAALRRERMTTVVDELGSILHEEIGRLPDRFRAPIVLCDLEGRSHEQAARHLGWPIGTVKSRHARGRERLRNRLERRGLAPSHGLLAAALESADNSVSIPPALVDSTATAAVKLSSIHTFLQGSVATLAQGVLRSMSVTQYARAASLLFALGATLTSAGWLAQRGTTPAVAQAQQNLRVPAGAELITCSVNPGRLLVNVIEPGALEVSQSVVGVCQVEGSTAILSIKPEGSAVKKGELICELDSAALRDQLLNQQLTEKQSETDYRRAQFARDTAELALREFSDGTSPRERAQLKGEMRLAQSAIERAEASLRRARDARERLKALSAARPGTGTPADVAAELDIDDRRDAADQTIERERKSFELATARLAVLEKYTAPRKTRELTIDVEQKKSDELAKRSAWMLAVSRTSKLAKQIEHCKIYAQGDGLLVYCNDPNRGFRNQPQIEEGSTVRERQLIFRICDLKKPLRVNVKVPEASVDRVLPGMDARVRIDAFPETRFSGKVTDVAPLPDATNFFTDNRKVYTTHVLLSEGSPALRPGMTAQVEIVIKDLERVLAVPVAAAVLFADQEYHVAVKKPDGGITWRKVALGSANERWVEVKQGIESGDQVVLNPLALMTEDEKREKLAKSPRRARPDPTQRTPGRPRDP